MSQHVLDQITPRDGGRMEFEQIVAGQFEGEARAAHDPVACITTCFSGITFICDGTTGEYHCGWLSMFG